MVPTLLVATWGGGVFALRSGAIERESPQGRVTGLTSDGCGGALAIVGGESLCRRSAEGRWTTIATSSSSLACCTALGDDIFVGTDDARVLRLKADGGLVPLAGFDRVAGRATWYAGAALVDGRMMGPPLGVRSMCGTCDHSIVLVNVHVGGIPRSSDKGETWKPTIDVEADVHQVSAHPARPELAAAATAVGLATSKDGGETWTTEHEGLHATHCAAVAFVGDDILVSASTDPFTKDGAVYRRTIDGSGPLRRVDGGLPGFFDGRVDTGGIAARGSFVAVADTGGHVYLSRDGGATWERIAEQIPYPTGLLFC